MSAEHRASTVTTQQKFKDAGLDDTRSAALMAQAAATRKEAG
jgi:hypothetical protein